mgnify:CR=1 FL=1
MITFTFFSFIGFGAFSGFGSLGSFTFGVLDVFGSFGSFGSFGGFGYRIFLGLPDLFFVIMGVESGTLSTISGDLLSTISSAG